MLLISRLIMNSQKDPLNSYLGKSMSLLLILFVLSLDGEHTGYSIIARIKELTQKRISLLAGSIYPQLERLEEEGLIDKDIRNDSSRSDEIIRQKSVYSVNTNGTKYLLKLWDDWEQFKLIISNFQPKTN